MADRSKLTVEQRQAELAKARAWKAANKERVRASRAAYYLANKEKENAMCREWRAAHPGNVASYHQQENQFLKTPEGRVIQAARRDRYRDQIRTRNRRTYATKPRCMVRIRLTTLLNQALRRYRVARAAGLEELVGCPMPDLVAILEAKFKPGMSWDRKSEIDIDHIRPISSFDWSDPEQQKACFHHSNLQLLWRHENRVKGSKIL